MYTTTFLQYSDRIKVAISRINQKEIPTKYGGGRVEFEKRYLHCFPTVEVFGEMNIGRLRLKYPSMRVTLFTILTTACVNLELGR